VIRVVLDTNVFLDCWLFGDPSALPLKAAIEAGRVIAVRSAATDTELRDVLARPVFGLSAASAEARFAQWCAHALLFDGPAPAAPGIRCTDPDDQKFLDLALAVRARVLFTKDKALLATARRARAHGLDVRAPAGAASVLLFEDDAS
jgi:predicted nucleic acid-binding protein